MAYPPALEELVRAFERFPGVGRRTAERLAFHVLNDAEAPLLARAIDRAVQETRRCSECGNFSVPDPCSLCADPSRNSAQVLVVELPRDVEAVERARCFRGRYHVLMGALQPALGIEAQHLALMPLIERLKTRPVQELILGTDPDAEGEATALALLEALDQAGLELTVTRLARGLPAGSALEYLHRGVLEDAFEGRRRLRGPRDAAAPADGDPRAD
jgi:recombination protein RecR